MQRSRSLNTMYIALLLTVALPLTGCPSASLFQNSPIDTGTPYPNASIQVTPPGIAMTPGSSQIFTVAVGNDANTPGWWLPDAVYYPNVNFGTINGQSGANASVLGNTVQYVAPSTPPIYPTSYDPRTQGVVLVGAAVSTDIISNPQVQAFVYVTILMPQVTVGLTPSSTSVGLGDTIALYGYAVGGTTNAVTWQVNGITGGNSTVGSFLTPYALYTAPKTMPMSGNSVTITMTSVADPTKIASTTITLH